MKLLFFLACWKRPEITEICFMGINRLRKLGVHDIQALAVISESSMMPLCKKYYIDYCVHKNLPVGKKKNFGLSIAKKYEFDYLVEIGSDDLLKNEFLTLYPFDKPIMGLSDLVFINTENQDCQRFISHGSFGLGRTIRRDVLKKLNWKIWGDHLNKGLDSGSEFKMAVKGFKVYRYPSPEPVAIDLKSKVNIWPYENFQGDEYPIEKALSGLSEEEVNAIRCLSLQKV